MLKCQCNALGSPESFPTLAAPPLHVLLYAHGSAWGLDPSRIAVGGDSAGAHLSLGATLQWRATGAPPLAGPPPTFIAAVAYDPLRDDSLVLAEFCKERGVFEGALSGNPGLRGSTIKSGAISRAATGRRQFWTLARPGSGAARGLSGLPKRCGGSPQSLVPPLV